MPLVISSSEEDDLLTKLSASKQEVDGKRLGAGGSRGGDEHAVLHRLVCGQDVVTVNLRATREPERCQSRDDLE
jgi:hypothetical protein